MSLVRYTPFDELFNRFAQINEPVLREDWAPAVDVTETDSHYEIALEVPAIAREDIQVSVDDGVLTVRGERRQEKVEGERVHRLERRYGKFVRSFRLPEHADEGSIAAKSENGVLTLTIAKQAKAQPRQIEVQVH